MAMENPIKGSENQFFHSGLFTADLIPVETATVLEHHWCVTNDA
jgi:hypothetical protein